MNDMIHTRNVATEVRSSHNRVAAILMAVFFGYWGVHRLYTGRYLTAILWFFTGGLFGFGWFYDVVMLAIGRFKDSDGRVLGPPQYRSVPSGAEGSYRALPVVDKFRARTEEEIALDEMDIDPLDEKFADLERQMKAG